MLTTHRQMLDQLLDALRPHRDRLPADVADLFNLHDRRAKLRHDVDALLTFTPSPTEIAAGADAASLIEREWATLRHNLDAANHALDDARARLDDVAAAFGQPAAWDGEWGDRVREAAADLADARHEFVRETAEHVARLDTCLAEADRTFAAAPAWLKPGLDLHLVALRAVRSTAEAAAARRRAEAPRRVRVAAYVAAFETWAPLSRLGDEERALLASALAHLPVVFPCDVPRDVDVYCAAFSAFLHGRASGVADARRAGATLRLTIRKSCLLKRLVYFGQPLRTERCPVHRGRWSGIRMERCPHGCDKLCGCTTGWLESPAT